MPHINDKTRQDDFNGQSFYRLLRKNNQGTLEFYWSQTPGTVGGYWRGGRKIYGSAKQADETGACPSAHRHINNGGYVDYRVFFAREQDAIDCGFRPCGSCMREKYKVWKQNTPA